MNNKFPFVTCYARILDRVTLKPITEFKDTLKQTNIWDLGIIHESKGGYSQYLIEFDIWNNEPDVSGGFTQQLFDNANNCKVSIWSDEDRTLINPIFQIRNSLFEKNDFINISKNKKFDIYGNVNKNNVGILHGIGDHTKFQVGIELPENLNFVGSDINFQVCFEYDAQDIFVNLPFDCTINLTNEIIKLDKIIVGNSTGVLSGDITGTKPQQTIIEVYDINQVLKDQFVTINNKYNLFLQAGTYNFNIKNNIRNRRFNNSVVENGINPFHTKINSGLIYNVYDDVIEYLDDGYNKKEIHGYIINEYKEFVKDAEIIITQGDSLIVYYITDSTGQYKFELENGIYDIRLRSKDRKVKIFKDFNFEDGKGFFTELQQMSPDFINFNFICEY